MIRKALGEGGLPVADSRLLLALCSSFIQTITRCQEDLGLNKVAHKKKRERIHDAVVLSGSGKVL
jgi:hypothetical protein